MNSLDDHLLYIEGGNESDLKVKSNDSAAAGSTKRKELHGTTQVRALSGSWTDNPHGAVFHAYKIDFTCNTASELYSGFVLLTESKLNHDVANTKVDLYLLDKMVNSSVIPCGELHLASDEIKRAMGFHELLFNGLFGKLFKGSKASGTQREFLLQRDNNLLWSPSYVYLILPLDSPDITGDSWRINWKVIDSCVSAIEFMKNNAWLSAELSEKKDRKLTGETSSADRSCTSMGTISFANSSFSVGDLKDTVVMAIHTGRIYYVTDVLVNTSAESTFDGNPEGGPLKYSTFSDYFNKKYGIVLFHPSQPLLLLKQTHNPFNLLIDNEAGESRRKMLSNGSKVQPQNHVHMPPELLVSIDVPVSVLRAFYLIPSLMHRMETLMLACQLREEIAFDLNNFHMPSSLILEALTTLRCCEEFSSERLELLGDSVLKYAVSCHVFLKYPQKHEGQLSGQRQRAVCNATLHELGIKRGLHEYIRDNAFEPRRWVAPGQLSVHPVPCPHGIGTSEVPVDSRYQTIDENVILGKSCDRGHRWLVSKSIADCVEALIGAYYVGGGLVAALHLMKWLGIKAELEPSYIDKVINLASDRSYTHKIDEIIILQSKIGYEFSTKGLLLEAITHAKEREDGVGYSYERLEFLGDAVLDLLITWYLYQNHTDIDPGELTDLRSASVNNQHCQEREREFSLSYCYEHRIGETMADHADAAPLMAPSPMIEPCEIDLEAGPSEQIQCRICLESDGRDFIAPCKCKGTSKYVHRECLDHWRAVKEGFAFAHCTTCKAPYYLRVHALADRKWRTLKFRFFVTRDILFIFLAVQLVIASMAYLVYLIDTYQEFWLRQYWGFENHISFYYLCGALLFFALLGLSGCFITCYDRRVRNDLAQPCRELCLCCCHPGMCADCHLPGTLCMWTDCTTCFEGCASTAGECGSCLGGAGEAGLPVLFVVALVVLGLFTVIGIFYSVLVATMVGQRIWQRHYHILAKRMLTKEYVVEDADGEMSGSDWSPPPLPAEHVQQLKSLGLL